MYNNISVNMADDWLSLGSTCKVYNTLLVLLELVSPCVTCTLLDHLIGCTWLMLISYIFTLLISMALTIALR